MCDLNYIDERKWERDYLKKRCEQVGVEKEYVLYQSRLRAYYLGVFMIVDVCRTLIHCTMLLTTCQQTDEIYLDVVCYILVDIAVISVLWINFKEDLVARHIWIMYVTSILAVLIIVGVDMCLNFYHNYIDQYAIGSFCNTYITFIIYMFLPIPNAKGPLALGMVVSLTYCTFYFTFLTPIYDRNMFRINYYFNISADISYHICLNFLGAYFRIMREIVVRSSFLDRHQFVLEDIWLRNARAKEKMFLHSILPPQIAKPIQDNILNRIKVGERNHNVQIMHKSELMMAIQIHPDVTILYADVVNYTHLTTTLSVKRLVTLLHDLYARFDMAASRFKVQRIKFLGDCYYCVAGLTLPDPDHAKYCVDLGLCMVDNIREVRRQRNIIIDIRVGVHSGYLCAGVLGAVKLQYDIWGTDVLIANRLEATGVPSHIHISDRTLQRIDENTYNILPGTQAARHDSYLQMQHIKTFLIPPLQHERSIKDDSILRKESVASFHVAFNSANDNSDYSNTIELELRNEFEKMPVGPSSLIHAVRKLFYERMDENNSKNKHHPLISVWLLHFRDPRLEYDYMRQPDYMLKYSVLLAWWIGLCLVYIQIVYHSGETAFVYYIDAVVVLSLTIIVFIIWYKKLCYYRYSIVRRDKYNRISCWIFRCSEYIQGSIVLRITIYMYIVLLYFAIISMVLMDCNRDEFEIMNIESKIYHYETDSTLCFRPWVLTNCVCLIIGTTLIFTRIPFMMKMFISLIEAISYLIIALCQFEYIIHQSLTTNPTFNPEYAHCMLLIMSLISLYLMERQTEFNNKINFQWRVELRKKQYDAQLADQSISILLHNILPAHVVNVYLTSVAKHELYYEDYDMVAVMFATLNNFELILPHLHVLNEIISEFDRILGFYKEEFLVEKIKIVGCTYMAACGLDLRFSGRFNDQHYLPKNPSSNICNEIKRARISLATYHKKNEIAKNEEVVFVMTTFALDLMRTLWVCNKEYRHLPLDTEVYNTELRIGISNGEVMAGVVGASQVHYDIWGNAVNMASRMDSTGLAGHIQVTDYTAEILIKCGIQCNYRGMTFVKGRGLMPTYFVGINENYDFIYTTTGPGQIVRQPPLGTTKLISGSKSDVPPN